MEAGLDLLKFGWSVSDNEDDTGTLPENFKVIFLVMLFLENKPPISRLWNKSPISSFEEN